MVKIRRTSSSSQGRDVHLHSVLSTRDIPANVLRSCCRFSQSRVSPLSPSTPPCPGLICVSHSRCPAMQGLTMGREVGFMISEGPWLFVGIPDAVKIFVKGTIMFY